MSIAAIEGVDIREAGPALKKRCFLQRGFEISKRVGHVKRVLEGIAAGVCKVHCSLVACEDCALAASKP